MNSDLTIFILFHIMIFVCFSCVRSGTGSLRSDWTFSLTLTIKSIMKHIHKNNSCFQNNKQDVNAKNLFANNMNFLDAIHPTRVHNHSNTGTSISIEMIYQSMASCENTILRIRTSLSKHHNIPRYINELAQHLDNFLV